MSASTPSIVPAGHDQNTYLVINCYGSLGSAFAETDLGRTDLETTITDLMTGQHSNPLDVVMFNTEANRAEKVSRAIANEILRRFSISGKDVPACLNDFIEQHLGPERQLTLRLA